MYELRSHSIVATEFDSNACEPLYVLLGARVGNGVALRGLGYCGRLGQCYLRSIMSKASDDFEKIIARTHELLARIMHE